METEKEIRKKLKPLLISETALRGQEWDLANVGPTLNEGYISASLAEVRQKLAKIDPEIQDLRDRLKRAKAKRRRRNQK